MLSPADLQFDADGLIPAVCQDAGTGEVLMVAWMNEEAVRLTAETGRATFWSRSRQEIWVKGATSGSALAVTAMVRDCDADTLLVLARPTGPVCHTGEATCFTTEVEPPTIEIGRLWSTVVDRAATRPPGSYTATLLESGDLTARKLLEEAGEVAFAAKDHDAGRDRRPVIEEAADLTYHLFVLLAQHGIELGEVAAELARRR